MPFLKGLNWLLIRVFTVSNAWQLSNNNYVFWNRDYTDSINLKFQQVMCYIRVKEGFDSIFFSHITRNLHSEVHNLDNSTATMDTSTLQIYHYYQHILLSRQLCTPYIPVPQATRKKSFKSAQKSVCRIKYSNLTQFLHIPWKYKGCLQHKWQTTKEMDSPIIVMKNMLQVIGVKNRNCSKLICPLKT